MALHFSEGDSEELKKVADMMGPGLIDASLRQTLQMLWMIMPEDKKNVDEVEREFRRLADRALRDLREDFEAFRTGRSD